MLFTLCFSSITSLFQLCLAPWLAFPKLSKARCYSLVMSLSYPLVHLLQLTQKCWKLLLTEPIYRFEPHWKITTFFVQSGRLLHHQVNPRGAHLSASTSQFQNVYYFDRFNYFPWVPSWQVQDKTDWRIVSFHLLWYHCKLINTVSPSEAERGWRDVFVNAN